MPPTATLYRPTGPAELAENWNVKESGSGYVTKSEVLEEFIGKYEIHHVGAHYHTEWWIPAGELEQLDDHIIGEIEVIRSFGVAVPNSE